MYPRLAILALLLLGALELVAARQRAGRSFDLAALQDGEDSDYANEIEDTRLKLNEPYKSLLQNAARFTLANSRVSNFLNIDTAMNLLNSLVYKLSKRSALAKAIKTVAIFIASIVTGSIFFPETYTFMDKLWQDPFRTLNLDGYLSNGSSEQSVLDTINSRADEALDRLGLNDTSCRERSMCYTGQLVKCMFPTSSETIAKFVSENFSQTSYKNNKYLKAFSDGFVGQSCSGVQMGASDPKSCLARFTASFFADDDHREAPAKPSPEPRNSRQVLSVARARNNR